MPAAWRSTAVACTGDSTRFSHAVKAISCFCIHILQRGSSRDSEHLSPVDLAGQAATSATAAHTIVTHWLWYAVTLSCERRGSASGIAAKDTRRRLAGGGGSRTASLRRRRTVTRLTPAASAADDSSSRNDPSAIASGAAPGRDLHSPFDAAALLPSIRSTGGAATRLGD